MFFHLASLVALHLGTTSAAPANEVVAAAAVTGPCDIYAAGNTPCVAAHSTTRALFGAYTGSLYQVRRGSDNATSNITPLSAGGVANAATQDSFCSSTTCVITIIYDQSGKGNHLTQAPPGGAAQGPNVGGLDDLAGATGAPVTLNGQKAYGVFIAPFTGYRNDATNGIATGDNPEGLYSVFDGTHYNGACCFDYGNAETSALDTGAGHMEAIYFGLGTGFNIGSGSGPWILADLENGLYNSANLGVVVNQNEPTINNRFITAVVKGNSGNSWAIKGGNANSGALTTYFAGARPPPPDSSEHYNPMSKEGSIILGIGGDNSNGAQGTFYEGVMTSGYPSDATENAVQANIVAANYAPTYLVSGPSVSIGSTVTFRATTPCCTTDYIWHNGTSIQISTAGTGTDAARWVARAGMAAINCFSFESVDTPGSFIRHSAYQLVLNANDGSLDGQGSTLRSWSYPARNWRHYDFNVFIAANGGHLAADSPSLYNDDASFVIGSGF
ncbi:putative alpha-L-arabinofuranosidase B [Lachnellula suecica]|uniref:Alpha-L-arabinofuranosidase n=1 Tax=Lachnellula suecica TaxID=602035 RepID=A0A8T9BW43_9HELO|nr:putative alpha-L-arabinofuranosidase B [Lachnellula suecica]